MQRCRDGTEKQEGGSSEVVLQESHETSNLHVLSFIISIIPPRWANDRIN